MKMKKNESDINETVKWRNKSEEQKTCENGKPSIMEDSAIMCDEIIDEAKTVSTNFNEKNINCGIQNCYILLSFLLITIPLLIAVSIYCHLIKY